MSIYNKIVIIFGVLFLCSIMGEELLLKDRYLVFMKSDSSAKKSMNLISVPLIIHGVKNFSKNELLLDPSILQASSVLEIKYDLEGMCLLGGPSSYVSLVTKDKTMYSVSLSDYGENCSYGNQTVKVPISDFLTNQPLENISSIGTQFWYPSTYHFTINSILIHNNKFDFISTPSTNLIAKIHHSKTKQRKISRVPIVTSEMESAKKNKTSDSNSSYQNTQ